MDKDEARLVAAQQLRRYRERTRAQLLELLDEPDVFLVKGPSGKSYQVSVQALWDREDGGDLRVLVGVDGGGWSTLSPLCEDFIIRPDGSFVGE